MSTSTWLSSQRAIPIVAAAVVIVDQITKAMCLAQIPLHSRIPLIDGVLALTYVRNRGMAFGLFNGIGAWWLPWALAAVAVLAVAIIWSYARHESTSLVVGLAFGGILGGAIGNLIDRVRFGYVVDFILAHWGEYEWPAFNVADSAITMGGIVLFIALAREPNDEAGSEDGDADPGIATGGDDAINEDIRS